MTIMRFAQIIWLCIWIDCYYSFFDWLLLSTLLAFNSLFSSSTEGSVRRFERFTFHYHPFCQRNLYCFWWQCSFISRLDSIFNQLSRFKWRVSKPTFIPSDWLPWLWFQQRQTISWLDLGWNQTSSPFASSTLANDTSSGLFQYQISLFRTFIGFCCMLTICE